MAKQLGTMEFWFKDYTENEFNQSVDCTFEVWGDDMSIEQYWYMCKQFAAVMGFSEGTICEWFGE